MYTEFRCPECGTTHFGSVMLKDGASWEGHCNGYVLQRADPSKGRYSDTIERCRFTWRREDDWRFWRFVPRTKEEFEAEYAKTLPQQNVFDIAQMPKKR